MAYCEVEESHALNVAKQIVGDDALEASSDAWRGGVSMSAVAKSPSAVSDGSKVKKMTRQEKEELPYDSSPTLPLPVKKGAVEFGGFEEDKMAMVMQVWDFVTSFKDQLDLHDAFVPSIEDLCRALHERDAVVSGADGAGSSVAGGGAADEEQGDSGGEFGSGPVRAEVLLPRLAAALVAPLVPHLFTKGLGLVGTWDERLTALVPVTSFTWPELARTALLHARSVAVPSRSLCSLYTTRT